MLSNPRLRHAVRHCVSYELSAALRRDLGLAAGRVMRDEAFGAVDLPGGVLGAGGDGAGAADGDTDTPRGVMWREGGGVGGMGLGQARRWPGRCTKFSARRRREFKHVSPMHGSEHVHGSVGDGCDDDGD